MNRTTVVVYLWVLHARFSIARTKSQVFVLIYQIKWFALTSALKCFLDERNRTAWMLTNAKTKKRSLQQFRIKKIKKNNVDICVCWISTRIRLAVAALHRKWFSRDNAIKRSAYVHTLKLWLEKKLKFYRKSINHNITT